MSKKKEKMMKQLLVTTGVLVVLLLTYFLIIKPTEEKEDNWGKVVLFEGVEAGDIQGIQIQYLDGTTLYQSLLNKVSNEWEMIMPMSIDADQKAIEKIIEDLLLVESEKMVTNVTAEQFAEFGFDYPNLSLSLILEDGTSHTVVNGMLTPIDNYYYTMVDFDSNNIFITYAYKFSSSKKEPSDFANRTVFREEINPVSSVTNLSVKTVDGTLLEMLAYQTETGYDWRMESPYEADADDYAVKRYLLQIYTTEIFDYIAYDRYDEVLSYYELDMPEYFIKIAGENGFTNNFYISGLESSNFIYGYTTSKPGIGRVYSSDIEDLFSPVISNFMPIDTE